VSIEPTVGVFDFHCALQKSTDPQRTEVYVPDPVIDFLLTHVLTDTGRGEIDPTTVPADAAIGTDIAIPQRELRVAALLSAILTPG
jgi:hypothetical protein